MRLPNLLKPLTRKRLEPTPVETDVVPVDSDSLGWWRHNRVLESMEQNADNYRRYLLQRVTEGEPIYLGSARYGLHHVTFVLSGFGEDMAVAMAMPKWFENEVTSSAVVPDDNETCGHYVDRCLKYHLVATEVADTP